MNKNYLLLITILLSAVTALGQTHFHRMDTSGIHWTEDNEQYNTNGPGTGSQSIDDVFDYFTKGDTSFRNYTYAKIYYRLKYHDEIDNTFGMYGQPLTYYSSQNYGTSLPATLLGGIREDTNGRVYFTRFDTISQAERQTQLKYAKDTLSKYDVLLYDFRWKVGDTLYCAHNDCYDTAVIVSIDSVQLNNSSYRKRWNILYNRYLNDDNIIEGIGDTYGFNGLYEPSPFEGSNSLICFRDTTGYLYTEYTQDSSRNYFSCDSTNLTTTQVSVSASSLKIYPNPVQGECFLQYNIPANDNATLYIINVLGETVLQQNLQTYKHLQSIDMHLQPAGMYVAIIKSGQTSVKVPFIKQ